MNSILGKQWLLVALAGLFGIAANASAYTCYARANGAGCSGSYSGYHQSSKGLAIQDALSSCARSVPSKCYCSFDRCNESFSDDVVNPAGEHDHFLGWVRFVGTGPKEYPDLPGGKNLFSVTWRTASQSIRKDVSVPAHGKEAVYATPLKTKPTVSWFLNCPEGNSSCSCSDGGRYGSFTIDSKEVQEQDFVFDVRTARIDVNDMRILRQDGTAYYAKGTYSLVMLKTIQGRPRECTLVRQGTTKTGVDVPRGYKYKIVTSAVSEEGSQLSSTQELDLQ